MTQQYDDTDRGAAFPPRDNQSMILTGPINDNGDESRVAVVKSSLPDGRTIFDLYQKVGTLFDNESDKPNAPHFTGPWKGRRVAAWKQQKEDGSKYMSMRISDKQAPAMTPISETTATKIEADDIPF
jgi:uncharacterized protein (DUF736 family)